MNTDITVIAKVLSDKSCAAMIMLLMDGKFHTVTELAKVAKVKNHTATYHIKKFTENNLLDEEWHGRFHYYQLKQTGISELVEQLLNISCPPVINSLQGDIEKWTIFRTRTCYDHLAGKLGVSLKD